MAKRKRKQATQQQQQQYDNALKSLLEHHEREMIPFFLVGAVFLEVLNVEVLRAPLRVERVYKVRYRGQEHILHVEFESGPDKDMARRLLSYHAYLHELYGLPVISIIVYPFPTSIVESPLRELSGQEEILTFHFQTLCLWKLDAASFLQDHLVSMYALLPTMRGANAELLLQALSEMAEYYKGQGTELANQLKWLGVLLRRAEIMAAQDQQEIQERLNMWDNLIEQDEHLQKIIARAVEKRAEQVEKLAEQRAEQRARELAEQRAKELAEQRAKELAEQRAKELAEQRARELAEQQAKELAEQRARELAEQQARELAEQRAKELAEQRARELAEQQARELAEQREVDASQKMLLDLIEVRFPQLAELAQQRVKPIKETVILRQFMKQVAVASDEATARWIISTYAA